MYQVMSQEGNRIEIALEGDLTADEFRQVVHQLESLSAAHESIRVLFDATEVDGYDFKIALEEYDFYKEYRDKLERIALVSDGKFERFAVRLFDKFAGTELKAFPLARRAEARDWIWR